jgi:hypothetical protein
VVEVAPFDFQAVKVDGSWLVAVKVPDYEPPTWPDPTVPICT